MRVGLHPRSFEGDHYDVPQERYAAVLAAGATSTTGADVVRRLIRERAAAAPAAGTGRWPAYRRWSSPTAPARPSTSSSDRPVTAGGVFAAMCFVQDAAGPFAVVHSPRRDAWGSPGGWRDAEVGFRGCGARGREETGLVVSADDLEVCAYERFTVDGEVKGRWLPGRSYLQVYRTRLPGTGPAMVATEDDVDEVALGGPIRVRAAVRWRLLVATGSAAVRVAVAGRA